MGDFCTCKYGCKYRQRQWEELKRRKPFWDDKWIIGGDFNDIKDNEENRGGRRREESSFMDFKNFIVMWKWEK